VSGMRIAAGAGRLPVVVLVASCSSSCGSPAGFSVVVLCVLLLLVSSLESGRSEVVMGMYVMMMMMG